MSIQNALNTAMYSRLSGGTALITALGGTSIYWLQAPDGASLPYVVFSLQGGGDENITPRRMKNEVYFVRGYSAVSAQAGSIDALCDSLLHGKALSVSGWANFWLVRENDLANVENTEAGEQVYMSGGFYRIRLDKS